MPDYGGMQTSNDDDQLGTQPLDLRTNKRDIPTDLPTSSTAFKVGVRLKLRPDASLESRQSSSPSRSHAIESGSTALAQPGKSNWTRHSLPPNSTITRASTAASTPAEQPGFMHRALVEPPGSGGSTESGLPTRVVQQGNMNTSPVVCMAQSNSNTATGAEKSSSFSTGQTFQSSAINTSQIKQLASMFSIHNRSLRSAVNKTRTSDLGSVVNQTRTSGLGSTVPQTMPPCPGTTVHQARPSGPGTTVHQARPSGPGTTVHQARPSGPGTTVHQARPSGPGTTVHQARPSGPAPIIPKTVVRPSSPESELYILSSDSDYDIPSGQVASATPGEASEDEIDEFDSAESSKMEMTKTRVANAKGCVSAMGAGHTGTTGRISPELYSDDDDYPLPVLSNPFGLTSREGTHNSSMSVTSQEGARLTGKRLRLSLRTTKTSQPIVSKPHREQESSSDALSERLQSKKNVTCKKSPLIKMSKFNIPKNADIRKYCVKVDRADVKKHVMKIPRIESSDDFIVVSPTKPRKARKRTASQASQINKRKASSSSNSSDQSNFVSLSQKRVVSRTIRATVGSAKKKRRTEGVSRRVDSYESESSLDGIEKYISRKRRGVLKHSKTSTETDDYVNVENVSDVVSSSDTDESVVFQPGKACKKRMILDSTDTNSSMVATPKKISKTASDAMLVTPNSTSEMTIKIQSKPSNLLTSQSKQVKNKSDGDDSDSRCLITGINTNANSTKAKSLAKTVEHSKVTCPDSKEQNVLNHVIDVCSTSKSGPSGFIGSSTRSSVNRQTLLVQPLNKETMGEIEDPLGTGSQFSNEEIDALKELSESLLLDDWEVEMDLPHDGLIAPGHKSTPIAQDVKPLRLESTPVVHKVKPHRFESTPVSHEVKPLRLESTPVGHALLSERPELTPVSHASPLIRSDHNRWVVSW